MAESSLQKKMSSLSSRSIRQKSSAILSANNSSSNTSSSHQHHSSVSSGTQLLASNSSSYARSIAEEDGTMLYEATSLNPSSSATTPPSNGSSSTTTATNNNIPSNSSAANSATTTNTVESLLALAHKRITTLVYIKKVHEGKVHWFNTILLSRPELEKWFDHQRMVTRTTKFAILGLSLSSLLDINNLQDFLKAMINLLQEFESIPNDNFKPRITGLSKGIFKQSSKSARKSAGGTDYSITLQDTGDTSFIYTPNIPFDLDYFEVWITLSDMLVEVYQKMIKFISTAVPGVGAGTTGATTAGTTAGSSSSTSPVIGGPVPVSLAGALPPAAASAGPGLPSVAQAPAAFHVPPPPTRSSSNYSIVSLHQTLLSHQHIELISRIDSKLKKLIVILTKEIDAMARAAIRDELANLDPMLLSATTANSPPSATVSPDFSSNPEWD